MAPRRGLFKGIVQIRSHRLLGNLLKPEITWRSPGALASRLRTWARRGLQTPRAVPIICVGLEAGRPQPYLIASAGASWESEEMREDGSQLDDVRSDTAVPLLGDL